MNGPKSRSVEVIIKIGGHILKLNSSMTANRWLNDKHKLVCYAGMMNLQAFKYWNSIFVFYANHVTTQQNTDNFYLKPTQITKKTFFVNTIYSIYLYTK